MNPGSLLTRYVSEFAGIERSIEPATGFWFVPVEVPSSDVALALAEWLADRGWNVRQVGPAPSTVQGLPRIDWRSTAEARACVVVVGSEPSSRSEEEAKGWHAALRALNLRRDVLARHLTCPVLWAGSASFLTDTAVSAPDLWSVRGLRLAIPPAAAAMMPYDVGMPESVPTGTWRRDLDAKVMQAERQNDLTASQELRAQHALQLMRAGQHQEARRIAEALLAVDAPSLDAQTEATARLALGGSLLWAWELIEAETQMLAARVGYASVSDQAGAAQIEFALGELYGALARPKEAQAATRRAAALAQTAGDARTEAFARVLLGRLLARAKSFGEAAESLLRGLEVANGANYREAAFYAQQQLAKLYLAQDRLDEAYQALTGARSVADSLEHPHYKALTQSLMGRLELARSSPTKAWRCYVQARHVYQSTNHIPGATEQLGWLSRTALVADAPALAVILAGRAWHEMEFTPSSWDIAVSLWDLTAAAARNGDASLVTIALRLCSNAAKALPNETGKQFTELARRILPSESPQVDLSQSEVEALRTQVDEALAAYAAEAGIAPDQAGEHEDQLDEWLAAHPKAAK